MGSKNNITIKAHEIPGFVDGFSMVFPSGSVLPRGTWREAAKEWGQLSRGKKGTEWIFISFQDGFLPSGELT
jgi:hypothetical protein